MFKSLIRTSACLLASCTFSLATFAQTEVKLLEKAPWKTSVSSYSNIESYVSLDGDVNVGLIDIDKKDQFAVTAMDGSLQTKWQTPLAGYPLGIGKFHGKILAIASSENSFWKSFKNIYNAFLIDPVSGKLLSQKQIYSGSDDFMEFPNLFFSKDGSFFKFSVRVTGMKKKVRMGLPGLAGIAGLMFTEKTMEKQFDQTQDFNLYSLGENLALINQVKPKLPDGSFVSGLSNDSGDIFFMTVKDKNFVQIAKYESGKTEPFKTISQPLNIDIKGTIGFSASVFPKVSETDRQVIYTVVGTEVNKGFDLVLSKFSFTDGSQTQTVQHLTNDKIKEIEKAYIKPNKDVDKPDLGPAKEFSVTGFKQIGSNILVVTNAAVVKTGTPHSTINYYAPLITDFSTDLKFSWQQVIPRSLGSFSAVKPAVDLYLREKDLMFIVNCDKGMASFKTYYGVLDINTGKTTKMVELPRKKVDNQSLADAGSVIWNSSNFIIPYLEPKLKLTSMDYQEHLMLMNY